MTTLADEALARATLSIERAIRRSGVEVDDVRDLTHQIVVALREEGWL